jgi:hypothetical protein
VSTIEPGETDGWHHQVSGSEWLFLVRSRKVDDRKMENVARTQNCSDTWVLGLTMYSAPVLLQAHVSSMGNTHSSVTGSSYTLSPERLILAHPLSAWVCVWSYSSLSGVTKLFLTCSCRETFRRVLAAILFGFSTHLWPVPVLREVQTVHYFVYLETFS